MCFFSSAHLDMSVYKYIENYVNILKYGNLNFKMQFWEMNYFPEFLSFPVPSLQSQTILPASLNVISLLRF